MFGLKVDKTNEVHEIIAPDMHTGLIPNFLMIRLTRGPEPL